MASNFDVVDTVCIIIAIIVGVYWYCVATHHSWKKRGVPGPKPVPFFGNFLDLTLLRTSLGECLKEMIDQFPGEPMVGIFAWRDPVLLIRDPDLIRDVLIRDFSHFSERGTPFYEDIDPLDAHLFNLETKRWRALRSKLTPVFTSGKMKQMFHFLVECANYFEKYLDNIIQSGQPVDCQEITAKFTTDVIGSCAFGLEMNALADEDSEFRKMGRKIFDVTWKTRMILILRTVFPLLYRLIRIPWTSKEATEFFIKSMKYTMDHRRKYNLQRGDLVDLLLEIKDSPKKMDFELTDSLITAQAYIFFIAGFETSSTTISHALYELAQRQDLQDRLRAECIETIKANNGKLSYVCIKDMRYLDMVFKETLRLRPPVVSFFRQTTSEYTFRKTNITIPKGQFVWIPIWAIHQDPQHYPNPQVFDPERFTDEMCANRHPMTYLPFGDGPRNCIGGRFAIYQTKIGLITILTKFKVEVCDKTPIPYNISPVKVFLEPIGGVHLKFTKISKVEKD